ncbi:MAG: glycosyltransferase family 4 protein [Aureliella sp.]
MNSSGGRLDFLLVGDRLDRKHGENNCRDCLADLLVDQGYSAVSAYKLSLGAAAKTKNLVLLPGAGTFTKLVEIPILLWHLATGAKAFLWFHNRSYSHWGFVSRVLTGWLGVKELCLQKLQAKNRRTAIHFPNFIEATSLRAQQRKTIVWLSRLERCKGAQTAYDTWRILYEQDSNWKLVMIGPEGDWSPAASGPVELVGPAYGDEKMDLLSSGGVFLLPSQYPSETQPLVVAEAMSVGMPVVMSNINNIDEMIRNPCVAGFSAGPTESPLVYAELVLRAYKDWQNLSEQAIENVATVYSREAFSARLMRVFGLPIEP